ncbi:MAG: hypothetical protein EPO11_02125, partial [Gammaproteobacteria bacterium]
MKQPFEILERFSAQKLEALLKQLTPEELKPIIAPFAKQLFTEYSKLTKAEKGIDGKTDTIVKVLTDIAKKNPIFFREENLKKIDLLSQIYKKVEYGGNDYDFTLINLEVPMRVIIRENEFNTHALDKRYEEQLRYEESLK